jgi:lysine decarboxylase
MAHGVTPESLELAIAKAGAPRAAFIVSPTYYGMAADIEACAEVCHAAGVALVVDQAWGPHFGFHPDLPRSALQLGADAVLTSTHKIVGSLTQSAMLHVAPTGRIDPAEVARMVRLTRSTSPSALLMASLDAARRQLAVHGEALLARTMAAGDEARAVIDRMPGVRVIGDEFVGRPGVAGWDPMRIVIDVRGTGCTGYEVAAGLREGFDIHVELATHATMVLILGLGQPPADLERFAHDFGVVVDRIGRPGEAAALVRAAGALENEVVVPPREAFLGEAEVIDVDEAVGRVSAESIAGYPPGIPALLPGERITTELVAYLRELKDSGARLHGASDPRFRTIFVLTP